MDLMNANASHQEDGHLYGCSDCDFSTSSKRHLKMHVDALHKGVAVFDCKYCNYTGKTTRLLKDHIDVKHKGLKLHKCSKCSFHTAYSSSMKKHIDSVHKGIKRRRPVKKCHIVLQKILVKSSIGNYVGDKKLFIYECTYCSFVTKSPSEFKLHNKDKHGNSKAFQCKYCDSSYHSVHYLRDHIIAKHNDAMTLNSNIKKTVYIICH